jgi:predicted NUDIX family NTP pyrophosphohydrolase
MAKYSAGILLYRQRGAMTEVLLVHLGGPYWAKKDLGAWSVPKGEYAPGENALEAARREFEEETGFPVNGQFLQLKPVKQPGGKMVQVWAVEGDCDASAVKSNTFSMEWPPRSGKMQQFPEIDRAEWFTIDTAKSKILKGQIAIIDDLVRVISGQ